MSPYDGRLEICLNRVWGTICNHFWSRNDAIVACRQLGINATGKKFPLVPSILKYATGSRFTVSCYQHFGLYLVSPLLLCFPQAIACLFSYSEILYVTIFIIQKFMLNRMVEGLDQFCSLAYLAMVLKQILLSAETI